MSLGSKPRKVLCLETGKEYASIRSAGQEIGCDPTSIVRSCKKGGIAGGFTWKYLEEKNYERIKRVRVYKKGKYTYKKKEESESKNYLKGKNKRKKVICIETGVIYDSSCEAERQTGIDASQINGCCLKKFRYKTAKGFHWEFYEYKDKEAIKLREEHIYIGITKKVINLETGDVFSSMVEATKSYPKATQISSCIRGIQKISGDYHWVCWDSEVIYTEEYRKNKITEIEKTRLRSS